MQAITISCCEWKRRETKRTRKWWRCCECGTRAIKLISFAERDCGLSVALCRDRYMLMTVMMMVSRYPFLIHVCERWTRTSSCCLAHNTYSVIVTISFMPHWLSHSQYTLSVRSIGLVCDDDCASVYLCVYSCVCRRVFQTRLRP